MVKRSTYCVLIFLSFVIGGCAAGIVDPPPTTIEGGLEYFWPADITSANYERDSSGVKQSFKLIFQGITGGRVVGDISGSAASKLTYRITDQGILLENIGRNSIIPLPEGFRLISDGFIDSTIIAPREMKRVVVTGQSSLLAIDNHDTMFFSVDGGSTWQLSKWEGGKVTALISNGMTLYAGTENGDVYKSINLKEKWEKIVEETEGEVTALATLDDSIVYYAIGERVFRKAITNTNDTLIVVSDTNLDGKVTHLAVVHDQLSGDTAWLIAGTEGEGLFRLMIYQQKPGAEWMKTNSSQRIDRCRALVTANHKVLYALAETSGFVTLLSSVDKGASWVKATGDDLTSAHLLAYDDYYKNKLLVSGINSNSIAIYSGSASLQKIGSSTISASDKINDISAFNGVLAAATSDGIFISKSNGTEWSNVSAMGLTQTETMKVPASGGLLVLRLSENALTPDSGWVAGKCEGVVLGRLATVVMKATVLAPLTRLDLRSFGSVEFEDVIPIRYSLAPLNGLNLDVQIMIYFARGKGPVWIRELIGKTPLSETYRLPD